MIGLIFLSAFSFSLSQNEELEEKSLEIIQNLKNGKVDVIYSEFDDNMKSQITVDQVSMIWTQLISAFGDYKGIKTQNTIPSGNFSIVTTKLIFENSYANFKLTFDDSNQISGFFIAPESISQDEQYKLPDYIQTNNIVEEDIELDAEFKLKGKLTFNSKISKDIVFVLIHGSGPQDMDLTIGPNKFFKNLAFGLSEKGYSVVRYNKITYNHASALLSENNELTLKNEYFSSVNAAINFINSNSNLQDKKMILIGHSLGVNAATFYANNNKVDGLILLAGSPRNLAEIYGEQLEYIFNLDNELNEIEKKEIASFENKMTYYKSLKEDSEVLQDSLPMGLPKSYLDYLYKFNSIDNLKKSDKPILLVNGGTDYQVTEKDFNIWKNKLSHKKNVKLIYLKDLNHIFAKKDRMSVPEDYNNYSPIAPILFDELFNWIKTIK